MRLTTLAKFVYNILKNPYSLFEIKRWYFYHKQKDKSPLDYRIPWITFKAIDYLDSYLNNHIELFEYGSGGSTLFFAERVKKVISIEHDKKWYSFVKSVLSEFDNVELYLIEPQKHGIFRNKRKGYENLFFDDYVNSIEKFGEFDVIIIDGRQRNACFKKALKHIKRGGIVVFDNFDRYYYHKSLRFIDNTFERIDFYGFVPFGTMQSLTTIFKKVE